MSLPAKPLEGEPRRLFLAPIKRPTSNVWFRHQNIGARTLLKWYKKMCCLECHPELDSANCSSVQQSASLLRTSCQTAGNSRGSNSRTNLNISSADGSAIGQIRIAEKHSAEFENSVEISSESDEESVESKEDKEIELSVLDSHPETNSKDLTNHVSSEIDEITSCLDFSLREEVLQSSCDEKRNIAYLDFYIGGKHCNHSLLRFFHLPLAAATMYAPTLWPSSSSLNELSSPSQP
eukprot:Gb_09098 [translate_table: standard]